ncbi:hypothetical protein D3C72_1837640 [compost metagenome]
MLRGVRAASWTRSSSERKDWLKPDFGRAAMTTVPLPRRRAMRPRSCSWRRAARTVWRLASNSSANAFSAGSTVPTGYTSLAIRRASSSEMRVYSVMDMAWGQLATPSILSAGFPMAPSTGNPRR